MKCKKTRVVSNQELLSTASNAQQELLSKSCSCLASVGQQELQLLSKELLSKSCLAVNSPTTLLYVSQQEEEFRKHAASDPKLVETMTLLNVCDSRFSASVHHFVTVKHEQDKNRCFALSDASLSSE